MAPTALIMVLGLLAAGDQGRSATAEPLPAPPTIVTIADLAFISGAWTLSRGDSVVEEQWTQPRGGTLFGIGRTTRGDRTVAFEYLRIEARRDGIYYVASPGGRAATAFKLRQFAADRVVFENPAHDFPRRISYWREQERLCAEVSGTAKGKPSSERWCWEPAAP